MKAPLRDPVSVAALPGDIYGIAPASSAALGESAFEAHLAWGIAKARVLAPLVSGRGRRVALLTGDLMDRSRFEAAVHDAGLQLESWIPEPDQRPVVAFVDLTHPDADRAIEALASAGHQDDRLWPSRRRGCHGAGRPAWCRFGAGSFAVVPFNRRPFARVT